MFKALRRMIFPIIIIVLFFFAAMIVLEWGMGMSSRQDFSTANVAAVINGEEVSWQAFNRIYGNLLRAETANLDLDEDLSDEKTSEIQENAWRQLLHDRLIMQQVAKHKIAVTDEEIYAYLRMSPPLELQQLPYFLTDGKFDYQKYINAMADPQMAGYWASIESIVRNDIQKLKMQEMVVQAAHVTEAEIKEFFTAANEKIKVGMINVGYDRFSKPPPTNTEEEKLEYFEAHREDYKVEERAALNIVLIEKKPEPYDWEVSFNRCRELYDSVMAESDFADLAERYSEDEQSAKEGGDLGWFARGRMVEEFDNLAFSMKEDDVSEPIRTQFGWHIIKHHGYKEEMEIPRGKKEKEKVRKAHTSHILIKATASRETLDKAYRRLEDFQFSARKIGFFRAAEEAILPLKESSPFARNGNIQVIGRDRNASDFAFKHKVDDVSEVMENKKAFFVVQVSKRLPAGPATFEEAQQKVHLDLLTYKVQTVCRDTANAIWSEIEAGTKPEKAAKMFGEEYETPNEFSRGSFVKDLRRDPIAIGTAFSLIEPGQVTRPVDYEQGCVIFQLIERIPADLMEFMSKRDSVQNAIMISKQQEMFGRWFQNLVENSEIQNNTQRSPSGPDYM